MSGNKLTLTLVREQGLEFVRGLSWKQRALVAGGSLLVAATLYIFVQLIGKPEYKTLYSGLNPRDAEALGAQLKAKQIPFEISPDGASVQVPADKLDSARLEVASQPLPGSGRMGFELFDKPNWAGSDFSEKVNYQRALEAELERTLASMSEVEAVRVHLVMPAESLFTERQHAAKASVMVKLRSARLPERSEAAIRQLVAGAVDGLTPENVVVIDADTQLPVGGPAGEAGAEDQTLDQELAKRVVATLEPVVGAEGVRASVHVERDPTSGDETSETYDPNSSVAISMTRSEEQMGSGSPAGVPGTSSNLPNAKAPPASKADAESHSTKTETGTYAVNHTLRHLIEPAGRIKRIAAAVLVDDATDTEMRNNQRTITRRKRTPEEMKQIEGLTRAALGLDTARGDMLAVENLSFQTLQPEVPAPPSRAEKIQRILRNFTWLLRYAALACLFASVYVLLLRPLKKQLLATFRELPKRLTTNAAAAAIEGVAVPSGAELEGILGQSAGDGDAALKKISVLKKHLAEKVHREPTSATRLIQNWLQEGGVD
ncbi:MAG: flagellar basal-body MS-ring/collar protein FliF [Candidatus Korobacteraceae bacterium]